MPQALQQIKPALLAIAILFGIAVECQKAHAAPLETAIVAGGCFWCVEADFEKVRGVKEVVSGFAGGSIDNPTYKQVVRGGTGHLEAVQITYDPAQVSYRQLMDMFLRSIDPTDAGGQFCDRGQSYTTAIFASDAKQKADAQAAVGAAQLALGQSIVTPVRGAAKFFAADAYHQDYYKSSDRIITRFGPRKKSVAYKLYRDACGRDERVRQLWGSAAPFAGS